MIGCGGRLVLIGETPLTPHGVTTVMTQYICNISFCQTTLSLRTMAKLPKWFHDPRTPLNQLSPIEQRNLHIQRALLLVILAGAVGIITLQWRQIGLVGIVLVAVLAVLLIVLMALIFPTKW